MMKTLLSDLRDESHDLASLIMARKDANVLSRTTQFKDWTICDILIHLHMWNEAMIRLLDDPDGFAAMATTGLQATLQGIPARKLGRDWAEQRYGERQPEAIFTDWLDFLPVLSKRYASLEPDTRLPWVGPPMRAADSLIARHMETWAHGQAVYDIFGVIRKDSDRIKNIALLGIKTYGWSFKVRGKDVPKPKPCVELLAPSGAIWCWNDPQEDNFIKGSATEFCQVVTQTRNVEDTALEVRGAPAKAWMESAQCFAGKPETPPAPGLRFPLKPA